ncbi:hypothetical protein GG804_01985 [Sphingomonas histidinilytica]|uniref:hypothetical protein n=1 Tax=Sphingomonadales TaxID=204457 RepID=UPI00077022B9|nr:MULTISPECIES: hypothetical protein [Sphingomonadaceae]AMK23250.1 hypothetical protein K426_11570 [Sphingobium sp. TKS]MBO9375526.1 hypothetical protein [Rhizorhabdus histidinilytica]MCF8709074.1 hypothetical protein [Rhizorhapis sp. SPR117]
MAGGTTASITLHVEIIDSQAMWDHAFGIYAGVHLRYEVYDPAEPTRLGSALHDGFVAICGDRDTPDIGECLGMIFDPGASPPGIQIDDNSVEILPPPWDEKYSQFIGDRGELGTDGFGGGHD